MLAWIEGASFEVFAVYRTVVAVKETREWVSPGEPKGVCIAHTTKGVDNR